jgi:hypothetical protein
MNAPAKLLAGLAATALLGACAGTAAAYQACPDEGRARTVKPLPKVSVLRVHLPKRIDAPQPVPLQRQEIVRIVAGDLDGRPDTCQEAVASDGFETDFKLDRKSVV